MPDKKEKKNNRSTTKCKIDARLFAPTIFDRRSPGKNSLVKDERRYIYRVNGPCLFLPINVTSGHASFSLSPSFTHTHTHTCTNTHAESYSPRIPWLPRRTTTHSTRGNASFGPRDIEQTSRIDRSNDGEKRRRASVEGNASCLKTTLSNKLLRYIKGYTL